jgi:shikimate kinase
MSTSLTSFDTVSLIGMPGVGKSTVGVLLAKRLGLAFSDADISIQTREGRTLQEILDTDGYLRLREIEESVLLEMPLDNRVVATGGSVVYSPRIMQRLAAAGPVVYLRADLDTLRTRVAANPERGIASDAAHSFEDIYAERVPLYEHYASCTIDAASGSTDAVATLIVQELHA